MVNYELFIQPLLDRFEKLKEYGFGSSKKSSHDHGRDSVYRWERVCSWKKDVVQFTFFNDRPDTCRVGLQVSLTVEGRDYVLTAISVPQSIGQNDDYKFPKLLKEVRAKQIIDKIISDLLYSLSWFDKYNEKGKCLSIIRAATPEDNITIRKTGQIYPTVEKLLSEE